MNLIFIACFISLLMPAQPIDTPDLKAEALSQNLTLLQGFVNGAIIENNQHVIAVYGDPSPNPMQVDHVLFTHARRDVACIGRELVENGAKAIVPHGEAHFFTDVNPFWQGFAKKRFHDYDQQTTKILTKPMPVTQKVTGGMSLDLEGLKIQVVNTPGYTRNAVSYIAKIDGKKVAFTGDLIYGDGQLIDLYSLQDAIPETKLRGYHGYAARIAPLIDSLRLIEHEKPDLIIPARGPIITNPSQAVNTLIKRLQNVYRNYLEINALRWYFGDDHINTCAQRVLGEEAKINWMEMAETVNEHPPEWIEPMGNSRLIIAEDGSAFMIDCGSPRFIENLKKFLDEGKIKSVDGIYVTHYHDDHTDKVHAFVEEFNCPVYACAELEHILEHPEAYRLPAMTANPIHEVRAMKEGSTLDWKEFQMTFSYFPGQTILHGGLLVEKKNEERIFFIGDSFTPSGIDDYCLLNRNLLHPNTGYFYGLNVLKKMKPDYLLINQHVVPTFRYSRAKINRMISTLGKRVEMLRELFPWQDPNFGIDERWAQLQPYSIKGRPGEMVESYLKVYNHYNEPLSVEFYIEHDNSVVSTIGYGLGQDTTIPPRTERKFKITYKLASQAEPGWHVLAGDIKFGELQMKQWCEIMILVEDD